MNKDGKYHIIPYIENLDKEKRIELFYLPYYYTLREVMEYTRPKYALSLHSMTADYENSKKRTMEISLLYRKKGKLATMVSLIISLLIFVTQFQLEETFKKEGYKYAINDPYDANDGLCYATDIMTSYKYPEIIEGVLLEFRNDLCIDPKWRKKVVQMINPIINKLKDDLQIK